MRVALLDTSELVRMESWRATIRGMRQGLESQGCTVHNIETGPEPFALPLKAKQWFVQKATGRRMARDREPLLVHELARRVGKQIANAGCDVVLSPSSTPIAYLDCAQPVVFWTDAVFAGMLGFYESFSNLSDASIRNGNAMEQAALDRCAYAVYTSRWAAEQVERCYRIAPEKLKVLAYGAGFSGIPDSEVEAVVAARPARPVVLLFPAMEWARKGGDIAIDTARWLNENGLQTELRIAGAPPPFPLPEFARYLGKVGRVQIEREFAAAHFILLPTRADCTPNVFTEASASATPSLATDVGGVSALVVNGRNGQTFPLETGGAGYGSFVKSCLTSPGAYAALARGAHQEYRARLNWDVIGREITALLEQSLRASGR